MPDLQNRAGVNNREMKRRKPCLPKSSVRIEARFAARLITFVKREIIKSGSVHLYHVGNFGNFSLSAFRSKTRSDLFIISCGVRCRRDDKIDDEKVASQMYRRGKCENIYLADELDSNLIGRGSR